MDTKTIIDRLNMLPEALQYQVADYIEFLIIRYHANSESEEGLSQELKDLLDKRMEEYKANPNDVVSWDEVKDQFNTKHNYVL